MTFVAPRGEDDPLALAVKRASWASIALRQSAEDLRCTQDSLATERAAESGPRARARAGHRGVTAEGIAARIVGRLKLRPDLVAREGERMEQAARALVAISVIEQYASGEALAELQQARARLERLFRPDS
jgi:hypothetical protein